MAHRNSERRSYGHSTRSIYCLVACRYISDRKTYRFGILLNSPYAIAVRCLGLDGFSSLSTRVKTRKPS
jgi:hypothetical protein